MKKKIAIALSGGMDSLAAGFLLKKKTPNLLGIHFITGFEKQFPLDQTQNAISSIAHQLQIPVETIDIGEQFHNRVVDYFITAYQMGRTPNPCMVCNADIKFGILLEHAQKRGADQLATGHYAKISRDREGKYHLFRGADISKDQSYFLSLLTQKQLAAACFPLENLKKSDIRDMIKKYNLSPSAKHESQDICFIRDNAYADFLSRQPEFVSRPGDIVDINDQKIGEHKGLHCFTIGQRRGINIPAAEPYYVVRIIPKQHKLVVGPKSQLLVQKCLVSDINWMVTPPETEIFTQIQVRYRHHPVSCMLTPMGNNKAEVIFDSPQSAITPGQGAVFYAGNEVLGGGWIDG